jgi:hypothetical protein
LDKDSILIFLEYESAGLMNWLPSPALMAARHIKPARFNLSAPGIILENGTGLNRSAKDISIGF